jgi:predicted nucleotidyltransferase
MVMEDTPNSEVMNKLQSVLSEIPSIQLAILYGSAAHGRLRADSDIDLAIAEDKPLSAERRIELSADFSLYLHRNIDLVDLRTVHGLLLSEILTKGVKILIRDKEFYLKIIKENIYYNQDFLPYIKKILEKRNRRFAFG